MSSAPPGPRSPARRPGSSGGSGPGRRGGPGRSCQDRARARGGAGLVCAVLALGGAGQAGASPGLAGTRNLSLGGTGRASATGTSAAILNPAAMTSAQVFAIEPMYQYAARDRTHGIGLYVSDSLNSPWVALSLGYTFMRGSPDLRLTTAEGTRRRLRLSHFGHEVGLGLGINVVRNWLALGVKAKYQYASLRYLDDERRARNANDKLSAFGLDTSLQLNLAGWAAVAVVGENLVGPSRPAWTEADGLRRPLVDVSLADEPELELAGIRRVADYPRMLSHGVAIYPLGRPIFSLNVDASYDFTSYWGQDRIVRPVVGGSGEFILGPVPLRAGVTWDGRGRGRDDDRLYVSGGLGFIRPAQIGGAGVDIGAGFSQQVAGPQLETIFAVNVGLRLHPDL